MPIKRINVVCKREGGKLQKIVLIETIYNSIFNTFSSLLPYSISTHVFLELWYSAQIGRIFLFFFFFFFRILSEYSITFQFSNHSRSQNAKFLPIYHIILHICGIMCQKSRWSVHYGPSNVTRWAARRVSSFYWKTWKNLFLGPGTSENF